MLSTMGIYISCDNKQGELGILEILEVVELKLLSRYSSITGSMSLSPDSILGSRSSAQGGSAIEDFDFLLLRVLILSLIVLNLL